MAGKTEIVYPGLRLYDLAALPESGIAVWYQFDEGQNSIGYRRATDGRVLLQPLEATEEDWAKVREYLDGIGDWELAESLPGGWEGLTEEP